MKQTKGRVEDALHATRAAVAEGIVAGGGVALLRACRWSRSWPRSSRATSGSGRRSSPARCRSRSAPSPRTAARTARSMADEVATRGEKNPNIGYDANTDDYVDMLKAGIIDPLRVTRSALTNAASIAGLMLTTEVMVTKIDEDDKKSRVSRVDRLISRGQETGDQETGVGGKPQPACPSDPCLCYSDS